MKRSFADRLAAAGFVASLAVIAMLYGIVSSWWGWFPAPQVGLAHRTVMDLKNNWRNDLALSPTRHLVPPGDGGATPDPDRGFRVTDADRVAPGHTIVAGLNAEPNGSFHVVRLFDEDGAELHHWPIHYDQLDVEKKPQNVMLHGLEVYPDGSLAMTFDSGRAIARVDACGAPIWVTNGRYHHSLARNGEGQLVTWRDDTVVWMDEETGEEVRTLDFRNTVAPAMDGMQRGALDINTRTPETADQNIRYDEDPFHPNDAEPLTADLADAFPMFEVGDVLVSLRELNLVAVVDPDTAEMKWWRHGPWFKQHDPDFQPDGTITVYDNNTGYDRSGILRIDPADDSVTVDFRGSEELHFYSWRRGKHQMLENGNILITEAEHGRILEVAPDGALVWERHMVWDADTNVIVTEARKIPVDFFEGGVPSCTELQASLR